MRILSVYYGHDANCTLLEDGKPVIVLEKERRSRIKHDQGMMDLEEILEQYGWDPATIDVIAITPWVRPTFDGELFRSSAACRGSSTRTTGEGNFNCR